MTWRANKTINDFNRAEAKARSKGRAFSWTEKRSTHTPFPAFPEATKGYLQRIRMRMQRSTRRKKDLAVITTLFACLILIPLIMHLLRSLLHLPVP